MRKTALQNKPTLNSYSSNGKQTAKRTSDLIKFYAVLRLFEANSGHLQNVVLLNFKNTCIRFYKYQWP